MTKAIRGLSLVFCALCALLAGPAQAQDQTCSLHRAASLDMTTQTDGEIAVPATVNGRAIRLLVDTGDIYSTLDAAVADELQLKRELAGQAFRLMGNVVVYQMVAVDSFQLGQLSSSRFKFLVMPSQALHANTSGLLGPDIMSNYDVEFDFAHARFNMFSQDHCPNAVVYWTKSPYAQVPIHVDSSWHVSLPVTLDAKPMTAVVDSGADRSTMSMKTAKAIFGIDENNPALKKTGPMSINGAGFTQLYRYPFASMVLDGVTIQNPDIDIVPDAVYGTGTPDLIIGISVMRQLRVYIAYKEQMLYATPAEAQ